MDCNEARPLLDAAVDRELSAAEALRVEQHLATCPACRREAQALQAVSHAVRATDYFRAPDALRARIVAALPAIEPMRERIHEDAAATTTPPLSQPSPDEAPSRERETRARQRRPGVLGWAGIWAGIWAAWRTPRGARAGSDPVRGSGGALGWPSGGVAAAAAATIAVALAASIALVAHRPAGASTAFVDELVASHVRAQLSGHDIDVVSSDQHTVKPWFNGRLDYAPPVEDLAADGFALTGGRLDYVGHHRVGVLVYRYRKHVIDVYVMPEQDVGAPQAPTTLTSDGYALASWRDHGMIWWAVSDAEPAVLAQLHAALTARLNRPTPGAAG
ncbi:anti-sigma factor family protein [Trinickia acidisoli]|uniref:anti-sigma factor family protein n=1 Tax=Trinickia acidisoli TaxID=2767482 RepID=UPI001A8DBF0E|nr:anti-sigma factor [Trinickia acidisoli]